jgi:hypothetical protein
MFSTVALESMPTSTYPGKLALVTQGQAAVPGVNRPHTLVGLESGHLGLPKQMLGNELDMEGNVLGRTP